jgi:hypothetical protein
MVPQSEERSRLKDNRNNGTIPAALGLQGHRTSPQGPMIGAPSHAPPVQAQLSGVSGRRGSEVL